MRSRSRGNRPGNVNELAPEAVLRSAGAGCPVDGQLCQGTRFHACNNHPQRFPLHALRYHLSHAHYRLHLFAISPQSINLMRQAAHNGPNNSRTCESARGRDLATAATRHHPRAARNPTACAPSIPPALRMPIRISPRTSLLPSPQRVIPAVGIVRPPPPQSPSSQSQPQEPVCVFPRDLIVCLPADKLFLPELVEIRDEG